MKSLVKCLVAALAAWVLWPADLLAQSGTQRRPSDLADLSIEELANIDITSVSRRPERLQEAAASVFVISADDIRRSGARSLPEVLRLAPNLQVARGGNADYYITARGMNGSSNSPSNKLLVMIDGRSVYSPLFSGVFWDEPDVLLEDIERIEVISGPGGTLWGVNAVNGIINISTRPARATRGDLAVLRADTDGAQLGFRHGAGTADDTGSWRIDGKLFAIGHGNLASGATRDDGWTQGRLGLRADWERGNDRWGIDAGAWRGREGQPPPGVISAPEALGGLDEVDIHGGHAGAHWARSFEDGASVAVQAYLDTRYRRVPPTFADTVDIADVQFQHTLAARQAGSVVHALVWGGEYRYNRDRVDNSRYVAFLPASVRQAWASLYVQDDIALLAALRLSAGVRVERNPYTGAEFLPNARLAWRVTPLHSLWLAASRTARAPSRLDADSFVPGVPPYLLAGSPGIAAEVARVFELGYRGQVGRGLSWSVTAFRHLYDHLRTQETTADGGAIFRNQMQGRASGIGAWGSMQLSDALRLSLGVTALHEVFTLKPGSTDQLSTASAGFDPAYTAQLRASYTIAAARELELAVRHFAAIQPMVPGYTAVDLRFGWRVGRDLELSVIGTNLNGGHAEFGMPATRTVVPRTVGIKLVWQR